MTIYVGGQKFSHLGNTQIFCPEGSAIYDTSRIISRVYAGEQLVYPDKAFVAKGYGELTETTSGHPYWSGRITKRYVFSISSAHPVSFERRTSFIDDFGLVRNHQRLDTFLFRTTVTGDLYRLVYAGYSNADQLSRTEVIMQYEIDIESDWMSAELLEKVRAVNGYYYSWAERDGKTGGLAGGFTTPFGVVGQYGNWSFYVDQSLNIPIDFAGIASSDPTQHGSIEFDDMIAPHVEDNNREYGFVFGRIPITRIIYNNAQQIDTYPHSDITEEAPEEMRHVYLTDFPT